MHNFEGAAARRRPGDRADRRDGRGARRDAARLPTALRRHEESAPAERVHGPTGT